eukprot:c23057_g2_i1 orf=451-1503(-)
MPKDKSSSSHLCHKARDYAHRPYSGRGKGAAGNGLIEDASESRNDWEGVICPVCMETPHNAVLLQCSSYDKGCRPYMCDTSYRHSNCFDQYLKAHLACQKACSNRHEGGELGVEDNVGSARGGDGFALSPRLSVETVTVEQEVPHQTPAIVGSLEDASGERNLQTLRGGSQRVSSGDLLGLLCPLCRGHVQGCEVVKRARDSLNRKVRVCAGEACSFTGSYEELRAHARRDHPSARPADIDPARQRSWVRLERQRELGDVLSVIQSAMPHATVSGDYAIDVFGPVHSFIGGRPFRGVLRGHRRSGSSRQGLWGEILQQSQNNESSSSAAATNDPETESFRERLRRHQRRS